MSHNKCAPMCGIFNVALTKSMHKISVRERRRRRLKETGAERENGGEETQGNRPSPGKVAPTLANLDGPARAKEKHSFSE